MPKHYSTVLQEDTRNTYEVSRDNGPGYLHMQSFTVWTAPAGSVRSDGHVSRTGHVFLTVEHFTDNGYRRESIGFSPGSDWGTSSDNMSFSDIGDYPGASSHQFSSYNANFAASIETMLGNINGYRSGAKTPPNYNLKDSNCIDFVQDFLEAASVNITLAATPNGVLDQLKDVGDAYFTPIVVDLDGDGVQTLPSTAGVSFDFDGDGVAAATGWVSAKDGLLVMDIDKSGSIDSGAELFGEHTLLGNGNRARDGFQALAELDLDGSGIIDQSDAAWSSLGVWQDLNSNGISEAGELRTLEDWGIAAISLDALRNGGRDGSGNIHALDSKVWWADGHVTEAVDVLFRQGQNDWSMETEDQAALELDAEGLGLPDFEFCIPIDQQYQAA